MPAPFTIKKSRYNEFRDIVNKRSLTRSFVISKFGCTKFSTYYSLYCFYRRGILSVYSNTFGLEFNLFNKVGLTPFSTLPKGISFFVSVIEFDPRRGINFGAVLGE